MNTNDELFEAANEVLLCGNSLRNSEALLLKAQQMVSEAKVRWDNAQKILAQLEANKGKDHEAV